MASRTSGSSLKHLRDLFGVGTAVGLSDHELLRRYAATQDESAFEALVARYGPLVVATCRAVLRHQFDVEDAFQATFLVLARKAGSVRAADALGGWLHRVAYRAAVQLNVEAKRRQRRTHDREVSAMDIPDTQRPALDFDVRSIVHAEIDRLPESHRLPVVLCDLEGLTYEQAAGRLHWSMPALYHRLAKGRKLLRDRLVRRGISAVAVSAALELSSTSAAVAVPAAWAQSAVAAATGGPIPATVAALTDCIIRSLLMTRLKIAAATMLAMAAIASVGVAAVVATRIDDPKAPRTSPRAAQVANTPKPAAKTNHQPGSLTVEARDLVTDAPITGIRLEFSTGGGSKKIPAATDATGTAQFSHPADVRYFFVRASREGLVPQAIQWVYESSAPMPPDYLLFQMEKATTISGQVLDQDQKPLAGATVVVDVAKLYPRSRQWVAIKDASTKTDANGCWSFASVPARPDSVKLAAYHYLYLNEHSFYLCEDFKPLSALRDGTATLRLERGTTIEGTVLAPDGSPVAHAEVMYGDSARFGNAIPPAIADAQGRFALGIKPGVVSKLTTRRAGFGPALQIIRAGTEPQRITLRLEPARTLSGRIVDRAGKPIPTAQLRVKSWRGSESLYQDLKVDENGRFAWHEAPPDEVKIDVQASGYSAKNDLPLKAGNPHEITLTPSTLVKGTVLDAQTGQLIPHFSLVLGWVRDQGDHFLWQRGYGTDRQARKSPGSFEYTIGQPVHRFLLRVQSEGYLYEDTGLFSPDGTPHAFTFRLTRSEPIRGSVQKPDGSPAGNGFLYLVPSDDSLTLENGDVSSGQFKIRAMTTADGRFALPPQKGAFLLLAVMDAGFAVAHSRDFRGDNTLRLKDWARVSGTVKVGGKTAAGLALSSSPDTPPLVESQPRLDTQIFIKTDSSGRFEIPRMMPGRHVLGQWVPNGADRRSWFVSMATIDVESGKTLDLKIGELGRRVTGRLAKPPSSAWMVRKASIEPGDSKGQSRSAGVQVFSDGRFEALDLPPGDHLLEIKIHEPPPENACGWGRLIAAYTHSFRVSGEPGETPLDLGVLQPIEQGGQRLKVGDIAPDFALKTLDGRDLKPASVRGKFVLLDFWATWCAPCVAEIPNLEAVHKAFGAEPRFVMASLSLDERPEDALSFVKSKNLNWHQCIIGPESPVATAYGATAIPATFLIGPDGKILATDLRGEKTMTTVAEALKPRNPSPSAPAR